MSANIRALAMPYCLDLQPCGRYALLNRKYKPVGFSSRSFVYYEEYPVLFNVRITPKRAAAISLRGDPDPRRIILYNDGCIPTANSEAWLFYQAKLAILARLHHYSDDEYHEQDKAKRIRLANLRDAKRFTEPKGVAVSLPPNLSPR